MTETLCMVLKKACDLGGSSWPPYISLSCQEACKRSLILKMWSWRSHGKILKFSGGYTLSQADRVEGSAHPRTTEYNSGQYGQKEASYSHGVFSAEGGVMCEMAYTSG